MAPPVTSLLVASLLLPTFSWATSVIERSVGERARMADLVVLAQVLESRTIVQQGDPRRMLTVTKVVVGESYKGAAPSQLEVVQLGGRHGLWEARIPGDATFEKGETAILLLRCRDPRESNRCNLLVLGEGKILVEGGEAQLRSISSGKLARRPVAAVIEEIRSALAQLHEQVRKPPPKVNH
jgi:hypothetical protein